MHRPLTHVRLALAWLADAVEDIEEDEIGEALRRALASLSRDEELADLLDRAIRAAIAEIRQGQGRGTSRQEER